MMQTSFAMRMSNGDFEKYTQLWQHLQRRGKAYFTADDIREANIIFSDPVHDTDAWTAKLKLSRLVIDTGRRVPSSYEANHHRKVAVFKMRGLEDRWESAQR